MTDFYEPWVPAVGDRVRIRLSPECDFRCPNGCGGHQLAKQGLQGLVIEAIRADKPRVTICRFCDQLWDGYTVGYLEHFYLVAGLGWFAAVELIPLEDRE